MTVNNLHSAVEAYWGAHSGREEQAAYHEILLYGGIDGYGAGGWRGWLAALLRRLALRVDPC
jgi:hypothetical protein